MTEAVKDATRRPRLRRAAALALLLLGAAALTCLWAATRAPGWSRPPPTSPDEAASIENAVVRELTMPRPPDPAHAGPGWRSAEWTVSISEADAGAWLEHRLEAWLANRSLLDRWPPGLSRPVVTFEEGVVRAGVWVGQSPRWVSLALRPRIDGDGSVWLIAYQPRVGVLPVPRGVALGFLVPTDGPARPGVDRVIDAARGRAALADHAVVPLEGSRRVRVLRVVPRPGRLEVTCRTEVSP